MTKRTCILSGIVSLVLVAVVANNRAAQNPPAASLQTPRVLDTAGQRIRITEIAKGLVTPWSIAFLPDGDLLVAELPGRLRIIRNGVLDPKPVWELPHEPLYENSGTDKADGLHGLALHPQFAQNKLIYFSYIKWGERVKALNTGTEERGQTVAIARGRWDGKILQDVRDIFVADGAWNNAPDPWTPNYGGHFVFGPDNTLYVSIGDRDNLYNTDDSHLRMLAQDLSNHAGKTLRIRDDGGVPPDNPFVNRPGAKPEIYTYGHRNGYGLAVDPTTGTVWEGEIGPLGGDELNMLIPGGNYGWPLVSTGRNYSGHMVSDQPWWRAGIEMPKLFWTPSVSPSSLVFYTGNKFPRWKGNLIAGVLTTKELRRITFGEPSLPVGQEAIPLGTRPRDVIQGPDGNLYVATQVRSRDTAHTGTILRIEPAE
jgi:glucose/arabinose dehydrogenase